jgi:DNA polymerase III subunit delta'
LNAAVLDENFDEGPPAPRYNANLDGQQAAEEILTEGFASGKLAHAWMLTGPKGIGKATLAYRFARHILANGAVGNDADSGAASLFGADELPATSDASPLYLAPESPIFQRVAAGGHADLMSVERGLNSTGKLRSDIVVGDVRGVNRFLNLTAGEGGWRVVIVDSADEMNVNAANALLKVLEEPPSRALLLLVCHNPGRMLPTIRSRCRKLRLADLDESTVTELLGRYLPDLDVDTRNQLAALSEGSIGRALELAQADGAELQRQIMAFMTQMPSLNIPDLQDFGATMSKADAIPRFETMADLLRRCLARLVRHASGADLLGPVNAEEQALYARLANTARLDRWLQVWDKTDDLLRRTNRINLDRKQVILNIFLNISQAARGDT